MPLNQAFEGIHIDYEPPIMPYINILDNRVIEELVNEVNEIQKVRAQEADDFKKLYEEPMKEKVLDEKTRTLVEKDSDGYIRGIVYISKNYIEFGWFKASPDNIVILMNILGDQKPFGQGMYTGISREALPELMWSNKMGCYINKEGLSKERILQHQFRGQGNFPYQFPKRYEAVESFHLFDGAQTVLEDIKYPLADKLGYTFGLEFETSMGYIPQEKCFRDGLIPLRDGSISGIEYSTVVLEGNRGLNLLKQQLNTLKEYTKFNKECALHIHMGGFPVDPVSIFALYSLWYAVERQLVGDEYVPADTFRTSSYKANGKDYCRMLSGNSITFEELFKAATGKKYLGSLVQPHPSDIEKKAKWNIKSRYYGLNLINMLCYKGPKTVEFRFLRPSFNYRKITLWLYILNAVLKYAENLASVWKDTGRCGTEGMLQWVVNEKFNGILYMLNECYDKDTYEYLYDEITLLKMAVRAQHQNGDTCGRDIEFEEELFV